MVSEGMQGYSQSEIYMDKDWPGGVRGTCYVLCRNMNSGRYTINILSCQLTRTGDNIPMGRINAATSILPKPAEIFGTAILV